MGRSIALFGGLATCLFGLILFLMTFYTVSPYEAAVLTRFGNIVSIDGPGLHFKTPFVNNVDIFRTDIQSIVPSKPVNTYTIDNQEVDVVYNLFYRLPIEKLDYVYKNVRDYETRIQAMTIDRLKVVMGTINVEHVAEKRGEIRDKIKNLIKTDAAPFGIEVVDFQLTNLEYTDSFRKAVENSAKAKAEVVTREQLYQQALKDADTARAQAKGQADAKLLQAEADAKAIKLRGEAEAAAIKAQSDALAQQGLALVELRKAEKWDGRLPQQMLGSSPMPFMQVK